MTGLPQLRLLHFSDLHFGPKHICRPEDPSASRAGFPFLHDMLRRDLEHPDWSKSVWAVQSQSQEHSPVPLLIAATGDFAESALAEEFDEAHDFLSAIINAKSVLGSKVDPRHVFVVPGNHDVVFAQRRPEHRFAPYCQFVNKLFAPLQPAQRAYARPEDADQLNEVHAFPESKFLVAEINSSYYVEKDTIDQSRGQVDSTAIAVLRGKLKPYEGETGWIKIALIHHHPILLPSFIEPGRGVDSVLNAKSLLRVLRDHGIQLVLHGHKHYPQVFSYDPDSAWASAQAAIPQLVVAGGSCGSRGLPEGTHKCNTYNLITVKWNPKALQARVQILARGLIRTGPDVDLDPDQWSWKTLRIFDRVLSPYENLPLPRLTERVGPPSLADPVEAARKAEYERLKLNLPVVEVLPSLMPGQGYEARAWLVPHNHHQESPVRVTWSAGPRFPRKVLNKDAAPDFAVSFHYWGPMLIQVELEFKKGPKELAYVYARLPDSTTRR